MGRHAAVASTLRLSASLTTAPPSPPRRAARAVPPHAGCDDFERRFEALERRADAPLLFSAELGCGGKIANCSEVPPPPAREARDPAHQVRRTRARSGFFRGAAGHGAVSGEGITAQHTGSGARNITRAR